ncbi:MAG TPA: hypothetical protein VGM88_30400 [Kofleriaceae bacterium]|jgi:Co/Zn/Cd efflux system component
MFKTTQGTARGRALGRIALGAVLLAGGLAMFANSIDRELGASPYPSWLIIVSAWLAALLANQVVRLTVRGGENASPRLLAWSFVLPGVGFASIAPMTVQLLPVLLLTDERSLETWIAMSILCVGVAHVCFAGMLAVRGRAIALGKPAQTVFGVYWTVVLVSAIPGVALLGLPPLLTAITGLFLVPVLKWGDRLAQAEREAMALEPPAARIWNGARRSSV